MGGGGGGGGNKVLTSALLLRVLLLGRTRTSLKSNLMSESTLGMTVPSVTGKQV